MLEERPYTSTGDENLIVEEARAKILENLKSRPNMSLLVLKKRSTEERSPKEEEEFVKPSFSGHEFELNSLNSTVFLEFVEPSPDDTSFDMVFPKRRVVTQFDLQERMKKHQLENPGVPFKLNGPPKVNPRDYWTKRRAEKMREDEEEKMREDKEAKRSKLETAGAPFQFVSLREENE